MPSKDIRLEPTQAERVDIEESFKTHTDPQLLADLSARIRKQGSTALDSAEVSVASGPEAFFHELEPEPTPGGQALNEQARLAQEVWDWGI